MYSTNLLGKGTFAMPGSYPDTLVLTTPRLVMRQLSAADWPFYLSLQSNPAVMKFISDPRNEEAARAGFDTRLPHWQPGSQHWLCLVIMQRASGVPVGLTGFLPDGNAQAEVGFMLSPDWHRQGYGYESLQAVVKYCFTTLGLHKLTATVTAGNQGSRALLEKAGFCLEGTRRESYWLGGEWRDDWLFGLLAREAAL